MAEAEFETTIAALATPAGEGGISIIRLSGPESLRVAELLFFPKSKKKVSDFPTHTLHAGEIRDRRGDLVDQVLISVFRTPHSYTGEDVVEISAHGGVRIAARILELLIENGARHAEPGEYTKRAFLNGKIDLVQAEAVLDLIKAKSRKSMEAAARQLAGGLSAKLKTLKDRLMRVLAHVEAAMDFPDERLEIDTNRDLTQGLASLEEEMEKLCQSFGRGSVLREGAKVVLVGKPNVGKSSLFNALLERDRALVSPFPGTTRDFLEESVDLSGFPIRLIDTAGLLASPSHPLDEMSVRKSVKSLEEADLALLILDGSDRVDEEDQAVYRRLRKSELPFFILMNKSDQPIRAEKSDLEAFSDSKGILKVSAVTGEGLEELTKKITAHFETLPGAEGEQITRLRHKQALEASLQSVRNARGILLTEGPLEVAAFELKTSLGAIRELAGDVYSEDLLDVIFSEFCIGK